MIPQNKFTLFFTFAKIKGGYMYQSTTHLAHGIDITDMEAQYDENASKGNRKFQNFLLFPVNEDKPLILKSSVV